MKKEIMMKVVDAVKEAMSCPQYMSIKDYKNAERVLKKFFKNKDYTLKDRNLSRIQFFYCKIDGKNAEAFIDLEAKSAVYYWGGKLVWRENYESHKHLIKAELGELKDLYNDFDFQKFDFEDRIGYYKSKGSKLVVKNND